MVEEYMVILRLYTYSIETKPQQKARSIKKRMSMSTKALRYEALTKLYREEVDSNDPWQTNSNSVVCRVHVCPLP